jgi:hypothetical protein
MRGAYYPRQANALLVGIMLPLRLGTGTALHNRKMICLRMQLCQCTKALAKILLSGYCPDDDDYRG